MSAPAKERVLLVDDEPQVLVALEDLLCERFIVLKTQSAEDALRVLDRERNIAVLITDQRMPRMTGDELLAQLGRSSEAQRILLTGFADLTAVIRAVNDGRIFAYVTKPWDADDLQLKVQTAAEHFRLAKELAHERQLLHDLMDNIPDLIYFKDRELLLRRSNRSFAAMIGASAEVRPMRETHAASIYLSSADAVAAEAEERRILTDGNPVVDVVREYRVSGGTRWLSETKAPIREPDGGVVGLVGISRDVSERVTTQEALRESEERLQRQTRMLNSILDSMGEGVIAVAQSGHVLLFNRRARQILGMQLEGTLPVDWMARCGLRQADGRSEIPRDQDPLLRAMRGEPMLETELFVRAPKGPGTRVAVSATALLDEEGKLAGGIALLRDVTRQRSLEQQLTQAQKMEAVGRLAGGVAHDFNNLLAVILSYGELVRGETAPDGSARSDMGELIAAAQRAAGLTRQLLAFSRQQIARPQAVKLNDIGSNLEKMLRRVIGEDVELVTQYAAALGTVMADPGQIEQIIVNLAVNARDAMPQGGRLTIETANVRLDEAYAASHSGVVPGEYVRLSVRDTGTGMDAETKRQIFEPFFTTKEVGVGTGLGLSTVYGIVQQSAGRIWVDSEPGNGSTFEIYLPRVDAVEKAPERPTPVPSATKGSATILLIEDDYAVRRVAVRILRDIGYVVLDAPSAGEARRLCATHGPSIDVLLTDVVMPEIRGPALAKELSAGNPRMRVIYMSGYPGAGVVQDSVLEAGANFIEKPFSPTSLVEKVREVLAQAPG